MDANIAARIDADIASAVPAAILRKTTPLSRSTPIPAPPPPASPTPEPEPPKPPTPAQVAALAVRAKAQAIASATPEELALLDTVIEAVEDSPTAMSKRRATMAAVALVKNVRNPKLVTWPERQFAAEYCVDGNGRQAAIRIGCNPKTANRIAHQWLQKPRVIAIIAEYRKTIIETVTINAEQVLELLVENLKRSMQSIPVLDKLGNTTGVWQWEPQAANVALKMLGQHFGLFPDRRELTGKDGGPIDVRNVVINVEYAQPPDTVPALGANDANEQDG